MENEQTENNAMTNVLPTNTSTAPAESIDQVVKLKANLDAGQPAEQILPPVLGDYFSRVMSPFVISTGTLTTGSATGTLLKSIPISPTVEYWSSAFVPYFCHEAYKYAYYTGTFTVRIIFFCSSAYRGSIELVRSFTSTSVPTINKANMIRHVHVLDGGNFVHEHVMRMHAKANVRHSFINVNNSFESPNVTIPFQDVFGEFLTMRVYSQIAVPGIFPTSIPYFIILQPHQDIQFLNRRNNFRSLLPNVTYSRRKQDGTIETVDEKINVENAHYWTK